MYFALKNKENVVYGAEEASVRFNPATLQDNEHMHVEIDESGEKVPVPNGYVGSKAIGENEIDTGYVIYEGEEEVNDSNVEEAQKTRNQYVWIPVPDASKMYGTDENGKKWGKLYDFTTEEGEGIDQVTGAKPLNWSEKNGIMKITNKSIYREPSVLKPGFDTDNRTKMNMQSFLINLEKEFSDMLGSIKIYGGFYIGRYETGDLNKDKPVTRCGNNNIGGKNWYTLYNNLKKMKGNNNNIKTGMIWGSQYDRTLMWLIETGNKTKKQICEDSTSWGNYLNSTFEYIDSKGKQVIKEKGKESIIPTGNSEYTKANNIYDLVGNVYDWTMEASDTMQRAKRGGVDFGIGTEDTARKRGGFVPTNSVYFNGCRAMLYIK